MNDATNVILETLFTKKQPIAHLRSPYGYVPTESVCIIFIVLFSLSTIIHSGQAIFFRIWWLFPTMILCGVLEILGWAARLWSSMNPSRLGPYTIQITATILGPTPFVAANFVILGRIIRRLGPEYSRLSPTRYTTLFCCFDIISLVVQAVGGGMASVAASNERNPAKGGHIMLGGIVFQLVTIFVYAICATEFFLRYLRDRPLKPRQVPNMPAEAAGYKSSRGFMTHNLRVMSVALFFSTLCLFIRAIYRTIELSDGWSGRIIRTQVLFNVLDGAMITLAMFTMNAAHPGLLLKETPQSQQEQSQSQFVSKNQLDSSEEKSVS